MIKDILFLSVMNGSAWGGSEELWYQAALWTARNGFTTGVCCFDWEGKEAKLQALKDAGCKLYLLPGKNKTKKQPLLGKFRLQKAVETIPFEKYDKVIVSQGGWKDVAYGPFKKLHQRLQEYVLIYHNYNATEKFSTRKFNSLQKWADKASKNLGDTPKIFEVLAETYALSIPRQEKLYNPLTFEPSLHPTPFPAADRKLILSVFASLDTERKAQDILVKALTAERWRDREFELRLYGTGKDKEMLQQLIAESGTDGKIILPGNAVDYRVAIQQTHLVLQITHIDAMPITVMDALAMARPVVVSNVGDMPSWIIDGENGWIADAVTVEGIKAILEKAWDQRQHWEKMGVQSFEIFQKNFPADPIVYFLRQAAIIK